MNPGLQHRGLAMVFNPTGQTLTRNITLPLYYTGIAERATVMREGAPPGVSINLDRDYTIELKSVVMEPRKITWFLIMSGDATLN